MASLEIAGASKAFGETHVLHNVDLKVEDGEFLVIVGPSGCGKSTLLRSIAGLEELSSGSIAIGEKRVDGLPPAERGIAMVFQSYALYPHMTLYENMAFALRLAKKPQAEIDSAVRAAASTLGIDHLLDRKPAALSGGQRQRVAIGRAIVREPDIFLFDEPLSNLDAALRVKMRYEFAALHKALATTTVYVTHDQVEAMTLADRIVVLQGGRIEQYGTPAEVYDRPANRFVAGFIGSPQMNFVAAKLVSASAQSCTLRLPSGASIEAAIDARGAKPDSILTLGIRPEHIERGKGVPMTVKFIEQLGSAATIHLETSECEEPILWQARDARGLAVGDTVDLAFPADRIHLFDVDGNALPHV